MHNTKHNENKIQEIDDKLMEEETNPQPFDFLFRYHTRKYPKTAHAELELPGKYHEMKDTVVFVIDDGVKQLDYLESIKSDGNMVKRDSLNDVEQQTGKLSQNKVRDIYEYCLYATIQHQKPCYPIVVTNHNYGKKYEDYIIDGFSFRIYYRIYDEKKVYKLLNTLKNKDYSKEEMSNKEFLRFAYCLVFAKKPYAKDIVEKLVNLFCSMEHLTHKQQLDLHLSLKTMIKYHFKDELKKQRRLLTMITKAVTELEHEEIIGYESKQMSIEEITLKYLKEKNRSIERGIKLEEKATQINEKDNQLEEQATQINKQAAQINEKDNQLNMKDVEIDQLKKRIKQLEGK